MNQKETIPLLLICCVSSKAVVLLENCVATWKRSPDVSPSLMALTVLLQVPYLCISTSSTPVPALTAARARISLEHQKRFWLQLQCLQLVCALCFSSAISWSLWYERLVFVRQYKTIWR